MKYIVKRASQLENKIQPCEEAKQEANYAELKKFRIENSTREKTSENTLKIKLTFSRYRNGTEYYQKYRYIKPDLIEEMELVKCDRCGIYMDGGSYRPDINRHLCYACQKEETLRECFELMEQRV